MNKDKKIMPFEYLNGREFTENLKRVLSCRNLEELGEILDIPKSTFATWNAHDRTSHELMVRLHLALGIPIEKLALKSEGLSVREVASSHDHIQETNTLTNPQNESVVVKSFCLSNGKLIDTGEIPYAARIFNSWNLDKKNTIEIETNEGRFLIDKTQNDAVSGEYLIDMSGRMSINYIQRLPNKLAVAFGNTTLEVADGDINVVGRVAVTLKKD
jgi:hypothetical protein